MNLSPFADARMRDGILAELYLIEQAIGGVNAGPASDEALRLEHYLRTYFRRLAEDVGGVDWEPIYARYVVTADLEGIVAQFLGGEEYLKAPAMQAAMRAAMFAIAPVINEKSQALHKVILDSLVLGYQLGDKEVFFRCKQQALGQRAQFAVRTGVAPEHGNIQHQAWEWAAFHAGDLIRGMDETSKNRVGELVSRGIREKLGVPGLQKLLLKDFQDMADWRARMIAWTEMNRAYSLASWNRLNTLGITHKRWITTDPCPNCRANGEQGPVPVHAPFKSGDQHPPAHPNCRCTVTGARARQAGVLQGGFTKQD